MIEHVSLLNLNFVALPPPPHSKVRVLLVSLPLLKLRSLRHTQSIDPIDDVTASEPTRLGRDAAAAAAGATPICINTATSLP